MGLNENWKGAECKFRKQENRCLACLDFGGRINSIKLV